MSEIDTKHSLEKLLERGNIASFGLLPHELPNFFENRTQGRARIYGTKKNETKIKNENTLSYEQLSEIREEKSDVYFLDREALKVFFVDFPGAARYVLVRPSFRFEWLVALPGILRRLYLGLLRFEGVLNIKTGQSQKRWLVFKHLLTETLHTRLSLSEEVGVEGFINFLHTRNVNYVVLRFFEKLPQLYRVGGDLDLLVSDEDERKVKAFLQEHTGNIGVDVWTVSRATFNDITYYPPPLARTILESAVDGPIGARIPSPRETFLAFAYHAVYHKGPFAGIPTSFSNLEVNKAPENDYKGVLEKQARDLDIQIPITMESLDEYLHKEGWRPKLDTLAKIATKNRWVWERFFAHTQSTEIGLSMIIIKRGAEQTGALQKILRSIHENENFKVLREVSFSKSEVARVTRHLRGGVWHGGTKTSDTFLPHTGVLILDTQLARASHIGLNIQNEKHGIRKFKRELRSAYDTGSGSVVHATDNTRETWEYVDVCFPEDNQLKNEIVHAVSAMRPNVLDYIQLYTRHAPRLFTYHFMRLRRKARHMLISMVMKV